ncbi:accessory gene regulator B family protein [Petroclostridium sp. X23]|uniref:accessory gene regulator ArgB-like protein n=1 Tax=Petroclostridium sp. X23 TaxID=3045146 RepID=UPI0024AD2BD2|nr:accessory gene regulator B family protein [Petroclostridium sp. X23]WHH57089.1 accessory gene regulator B family protein [Petroclostridium sp. X23]
MEKIAQKLTSAIQRERPELTDLQVRTIKFGLECLLGELSKLIMYFIIFSILSLTGYYLVALLFFSSLRLIAGGYHEDTYWRCFFTSLVIFAAIIVIGMNLPQSLLLKSGMLIVSVILTWLYAPVDHPNKPIISVERRRRFKYFSFGSVILMGIMSLLLPALYSGTAVVAILAEALSLPVGEYAKRRKCR